MTHEPECFYTGERFEGGWYDPEDDPCICDQIQAAYKRGREEAGIAITDRLLSANARGEMPSEDVVTLVKAARGERE